MSLCSLIYELKDEITQFMHNQQSQICRFAKKRIASLNAILDSLIIIYIYIIILNSLSMSSKSLKSYSYHFRNVHFNSPLTETLQHHSNMENSTHVDKKKLSSLNRYQSQKCINLQNADNQHKINPISDRYSQPTSRYTFSMLGKEQKAQKLMKKMGSNEIKKNDSFDIKNANMPLQIRDIVEEKHILDFQNQQNRQSIIVQKQENKNNPNDLTEKNICLIGKLQSTEQFQQTRLHNIQLAVRVKSLELQITKKDNQIGDLTTEIVKLTNRIQLKAEILVENENTSNQNRKAFNLSIQSNIVSLIFEHTPANDKRKDILLCFEKEYKQILSIFQIQPTEQFCHEVLLMQIQQSKNHLKELTDELNQYKQKLEQHLSLAKHFEISQQQKVKLVQLNNILQQELIKYCEMLEESNEQILRLQCERLNSKFNETEDKDIL